MVDRVADSAAAADRSRGAIEDSEEAVARHVDLPPAEPLELPAGHVDIPVQELSPATVTDRSGTLGRTHDVSEHHGDERAIWLGPGSRAGNEFFDLVDQEIHRLLIDGLEQMVVAGQLDSTHITDALFEGLVGDTIGKPLATLVENDDASEGREPFQQVLVDG